jgi:hypothetical protein
MKERGRTSWRLAVAWAEEGALGRAEGGRGYEGLGSRRMGVGCVLRRRAR